ncbi:MAG: hypothetical protein AB7U29_02580 [Desulfobulbus sp.]
MKKQLWLTSLTSDRSVPSAVSAKLGPYGFDVAGSLWNDDIERMGWQDSRDLLINPALAGWLLLTTPEELVKPTVRYGLSLLRLSVTAHNPRLPLFIISCGAPVKGSDLPTPLAGAHLLTLDEPAWCAKIVAKTSVPASPRQLEYRIDISGDQQVGQWFEIGPAQGSWKGSIFGVCGGEITFQAVGPASTLPKTTVLNYPMQGIQLTLGEREFTAWGVQNEVEEGMSYFAKVTGMPELLVFGPFPEGDEPELFTLKLV